MIADAKDKPSGELCVTTTVAFGTVWLAPGLKEFMDLYPALRFEMGVDDSELDLASPQAYVASHRWTPTQPALAYRTAITLLWERRAGGKERGGKRRCRWWKINK